MNDTVKVPVAYLSALLSQLAHTEGDLEEYQQIEITGMDYDPSSGFVSFYFNLKEEPIN